MAEEEPLAQLILEILRRKRRATLREIIMEIFREPRPRDYQLVRNILERLEIAGAVVKHVEPVRGSIIRYVWYDVRPFRRLIVRRPGQRITLLEISRVIGVPLEDVMRLIEFGKQRKWLTEVAPQLYVIPPRMWRVQKMRAWKTSRNPKYYKIQLKEKLEVPRQMILDGFAPSEVTDTFEIGVHGAMRITVYTYNPEAWPEQRLERIMRGLFAQEGITMEIYSDLPYIKTGQAYELKEVDIDEKPSELEIDEVDIWLWVAKDDGSTLAYHYRRRPWGWEYERYRVV
ncbi:MAG: hypothetical protein RMI45_08410 [Ignisphaera sp.]|nr:hypothetical protein [Ignisphaera sp.]